MESEKFLLWKQRLEEIKQSDLTVGEWCSQNGVSKHAYYYWRKKILDSINDDNKKSGTVNRVSRTIPKRYHCLFTDKFLCQPQPG